MRRVVIAGAPFALGDEVAAMLIRYSDALARRGRSDAVTVLAVGGMQVAMPTTVVVGAGREAEVRPGALAGPDPSDAIALGYMRCRIEDQTLPPSFSYRDVISRSRRGDALPCD